MEDQIYNDGEVYFNATNTDVDPDVDPDDINPDVDPDDTSPDVDQDDTNHRGSKGDDRSCSSTMLSNLTGILKDVVQELASLKQNQISPPTNLTTPVGTNPLIDQSNNNGFHCDRHEEPYNRRSDIHSEPRASFVPHVSKSFNGMSQRAAQGDDTYHYSHTPRYQYDRHDGLQHLQPSRTRSRAAEYTKIPSFTGKEDWQVWLARFEAIGKRFSRSDDEKLDKILPRLEGQAAQFAFVQLPSEKIHNYREFCREMNSRFRVIETPRAFAAKFSRRNQNHGEPAEDYAANLKMLYDKAHGYRNRRTRDEDLVRRFLDGLRDDEVRFEVEYHKEPDTIDQAVFHVVNWIQTRNEYYSERKHRSNVRAVREDPDQTDEETDDRACRIPNGHYTHRERESREPSNLKKSDSTEISQESLMKKILERLDNLEKDREASHKPVDRHSSYHRQDVVCYHCKQTGHIARNCPERRDDYHDRRKWSNRGSDSRSNDENLNFQGPSFEARGRSQ